jgi:hypothetical protein
LLESVLSFPPSLAEFSFAGNVIPAFEVRALRQQVAGLKRGRLLPLNELVGLTLLDDAFACPTAGVVFVQE